MNLPNINTIEGQEICIRAINNGTFSVTIDANGAQEIEGQLSYLMEEDEMLTLISWNGNWYLKQSNGRKQNTVYIDELVSDRNSSLANGESAWYYRVPENLDGYTITQVVYSVGDVSVGGNDRDWETNSSM